MDRIVDVQLGIPTPRSGDLVPVCRRRPVWPLGHLWTAQRIVGRLFPIRRLYRHANWFLPAAMIPALAMIATVAEALFGLLLVLGWNTRIVALLSGALLTTFALTMTVTLGVKSPLNFSVFSAAG